MQLIYRQGAAPDPALAQPRDSSEALAWLDAGNERFSHLAAAGSPPGADVATSLVLEGDFGVGPGRGRQREPHPFGIVLGCADESLPIELLFGRTANDL